MKIAIIGAGVVGVSSAYYLWQQGHEVSVYERLSDVALGAGKILSDLILGHASHLNPDPYSLIARKR
jgi:glycine/D-amino acid oxidase-like deaminating enzyme